MRKGEKKFSPEFRSYSTPARKFQKKQQKNSKNYKTSFRQYFQPKWDEIGRERKKKILGQNSADIRPRRENSEKNCKKIQKIKKPHSGNIPIQNGMRQAKKEKKKKKISPEFRSYSTRLRKFRKIQQKNSKLEKTSFWHYFLPKRDEIGREREKKILGPNSVHTLPRQGNSEKNSEKIH